MADFAVVAWRGRPQFDKVVLVHETNLDLAANFAVAVAEAAEGRMLVQALAVAVREVDRHPYRPQCSCSDQFAGGMPLLVPLALAVGLVAVGLVRFA